ncbi:MAG: DUF4286 family protein [Candidatus Kapabacteria bacterium]|nr:DUF4286 family protein [Candidatus Kapabacteria bacterium]MCS7169576.1 DUF4286 family protein [Candidatus Kapabacteria bacterium]MDW7997427.1 DUF4286 family protein [Bacteroidota bacterium]MDW8225499.1 DUF4286 family protein [Bacteroidota bacterium]
MVCYLVTAELPYQQAAEWETWMRQVHIPAVLATGCFERAALWRELVAGDTITYVVEYLCPAPDAFQRYEEQHAAALRQEHADRFGRSVRLHRRLLRLCCVLDLPPVQAP